ncbi:MAG: hypothetical protein NXI31_07265 [bacterium]|nr:hypothetical protein [bacterium]
MTAVVLNAGYVLRDDEIKTFRTQPEPRTFPAGQVLHRFVTRGETSVEGPWWFQPEVLRRIRLHASRRAIEAPDVARAWHAVRRDWSTRMDMLVTARLACPAIGWIGEARHQRYDDQRKNAHVQWIGGGEQVFLPNLLADTQHTPPELREAHRGLPVPRAVIVSTERFGDASTTPTRPYSNE